ncbi:MAG: hypothetical protein KDF65_09365, partial [Anaerolineae bacterium]|nr:hypothetical protein [Anaerolineae bacterium]
MTWLILLVSLALIGMAGIASLNSLTFPRLRAAVPEAGPSPTKIPPSIPPLRGEVSAPSPIRGGLGRGAEVNFDPPLSSQPDCPTPLVSLLIPARDEAAVIGQTVTRLLAQSYAHF